MTTAKIYTRTGDKGKTSLVSGVRVSKAHLRLESYGTVDELNSSIGVLRLEIQTEVSSVDRKVASELDEELNAIQNTLFNVGSQLACDDTELRGKLPEVSAEKVVALENSMDRFSETLVPLKNFILPGGSRSAAFAHVARTICRRAERLTVALLEAEGEQAVDEVVIHYINRLSDYLFVLARHLNRLMKKDEPIWKS